MSLTTSQKSQEDEDNNVNNENNRILSEKDLKEFLITIQNVLEQLKKDNPDATQEEKIKCVNKEFSSPILKGKVLNTLNVLGEPDPGKCIEDSLNEPYAKIVKAIFKVWNE